MTTAGTATAADNSDDATTQEDVVENGGSGSKKRTPRRKAPAKAAVASPKPQPRVEAEVYASKKPFGRQKWRFRITAFNGNILAVSSESYANQADAIVALRLVVGDHPIVGADV